MNSWGQQLPPFGAYSMKGCTYRFMSDPIFPLGYGLSYTTFSIGNAQVSKSKIKNDESIDLTIPVSNIGKRDGTEIVQVYFHEVNDVAGPLKTLRGFKKVVLAAGKLSEVKVNLTPSAFRFFEKTKNKMDVTPGQYEVYYGTSSDAKDIKMTKITIL